MRFSQVVGQDRVKAHLLQMVQGGQLPHALMFCGPKGAGKMALALAYARYLLCKSPSDGDACGTCSSCRMLDAYSHPDLHFSFPVYKRKSTDHPVSDDFMPQWRELLAQGPYFDMEAWLAVCKADNQQLVHYVYESDALRSKLMLKSNQGGRKVVVMWLPERMMVEMANKLLKLIEEPPPHTYFLLVTEDLDKVLETIRSRTQLIMVPSLSEEDIASSLERERAVPADAARHTAHVAQGSYTEALKRLMAGNEESAFFDSFVQLMRMCYKRDVRQMHRWSGTHAEMGRERQKRLLDYFQRLIRENFVYNFRHGEINYMSEDEQQFGRNFARFINERNVVGIMEEVALAQRDIEQNVNPRMVFFDFALKMTVLLIR